MEDWCYQKIYVQQETEQLLKLEKYHDYPEVVHLKCLGDQWMVWYAIGNHEFKKSQVNHYDERNDYVRYIGVMKWMTCKGKLFLRK